MPTYRFVCDDFDESIEIEAEDIEAAAEEYMSYFRICGDLPVGAVTSFYTTGADGRTWTFEI